MVVHLKLKLICMIGDGYLWDLYGVVRLEHGDIVLRDASFTSLQCGTQAVGTKPSIARGYLQALPFAYTAHVSHTRQTFCGISRNPT